DVEVAALAGEVLVELTAHPIDRLARTQHARAEAAGERVELMLPIGVVADPADTVVGHADEERPDGRLVDDVGGDVEQVRGGRSRTEAFAGRGGYRHVRSFRSRRTPADAAWRAACSVEPSAAPISS